MPLGKLLSDILDALRKNMPIVQKACDEKTRGQAKLYATNVEYVLAEVKVLTEAKEELGITHKIILCDLYNLMAKYNAKVQYNYIQALDYHQQAFEIIKKELNSDNHPELATKLAKKKANSLNNLGCAYTHLGNPQEALKCHREALEMRKKLYTDNHRKVANSLNYMGGTYSALGKYQESLYYFEQALKMREDLYKGNHSDKASSLNNMGGSL
jgi:tetratricopeptide (TPR) repeat protein